MERCFIYINTIVTIVLAIAVLFHLLLDACSYFHRCTDGFVCGAWQYPLSASFFTKQVYFLSIAWLLLQNTA